MPRFIPVPKLAVAPVSDPSAPSLVGAPPAPWVANSAHETVPAAAAGLAAAGAVVGAAAAGAEVGLAAAAGAAVGCVGVAVGEQAASVSANALRMATGARRPGAVSNIVSSPPQSRIGTGGIWASRYHATCTAQAESLSWPLGVERAMRS